MTPRATGRETQQVVDLVRAVAVAVNRLGEEFASTTGLHRTDAAALAMVMEASAGGTDIGPSQLARQLRITTAATSTLVDRLVKAGHLERVADTSDRRRLTLRITDSARHAGREFFGPVNTALLTAAGAFTAGELEVVARFLDEMRDAVVRHDSPA